MRFWREPAELHDMPVWLKPNATALATPAGMATATRCATISARRVHYRVPVVAVRLMLLLLPRRHAYHSPGETNTLIALAWQAVANNLPPT